MPAVRALQASRIHLGFLFLHAAIIRLVYRARCNASRHLIILKNRYYDLLLGSVTHHALENRISITNASFMRRRLYLHNLASRSSRINWSLMLLKAVKQGILGLN